MYACMHVCRRLSLLSLRRHPFSFFFYFPSFSHMVMLFFRHMNAIISYTELYHMHVPVIPKLIEIRLVSIE